MARRKPRPCEVQRWMKVTNGSVIRRWRLRRGLTQRELAFLVKKTQATISLIEKGGLDNISEALALDIARRLDVPWEDLFEARELIGMRSVTDGVAPAGRVA